MIFGFLSARPGFSVLNSGRHWRLQYSLETFESNLSLDCIENVCDIFLIMQGDWIIHVCIGATRRTPAPGGVGAGRERAWAGCPAKAGSQADNRLSPKLVRGSPFTRAKRERTHRSSGNRVSDLAQSKRSKSKKSAKEGDNGETLNWELKKTLSIQQRRKGSPLPGTILNT